MQPMTISLALFVVGALACGGGDAPASADAKAGEPPSTRENAAPPSKADSRPDETTNPRQDAKADPATSPSPGLLGQLEEARGQTACTELQMLRSAVELFTAMKGKCPPDLATLEKERMIAQLRDDPWGRAYRLRCDELELRSAGPDGEARTADDVVLGATGDACTAG